MQENEFSDSQLITSMIEVDDHTIRIVESGDPQKQLVLFIHGTPGSWDGYRKYLQMASLTSRAHLIAMDRPGFGDMLDQDWLPPFEAQASMLMKIKARNHSSLPIVLVGHSLGGSIAYRMAVDYADEIAGLVIISSPIDPVLAKRRWYNLVSETVVVTWMLPDSLVKANREMMPLQEALFAMEPLLPNINAQVTVIQGGKDSLVKFGNLAYAEKHLVNARFKSIPMEKMGHFILWEEPELIEKEILNLLQKTAGNNQS